MLLEIGDSNPNGDNYVRFDHTETVIVPAVDEHDEALAADNLELARAALERLLTDAGSSGREQIRQMQDMLRA